MAAGFDDKKSFNAADIEAYWKGKLSPVQMHAMEKAALDDPFLADAMEGYAAMLTKSGEPQKNIELLKDALEKRIHREQKSKVIAWWKPAIAALLILTAGTLTYRFWPSTQKPEIVNAETAKPETLDTSVVVIDIPGIADSLPSTAPVIAIQEKKSKSHLPDISSPALPRRTVPVQEKKVAARQESAETVELEKDKATAAQKNETGIQERNQEAAVARKTIEPKADRAFTPPVAANEKAAPAASRVLTAPGLTGVVVNETGKPIEGALVQLLRGKSAGISVVTDEKGRFAVPLPQKSDSVETLSVSTVGYIQANRRIAITDSKQDIAIRLKPADAALNEVVVTGYGGNGPSAIPSTGWESYRKYLSDSARIPDSLRTVHGEVVVSFGLRNNGKLSDLKIQKSLHPVLDAEAIRLIKDGPIWKNLRGKRNRTSLTVPF